MRVKLYGAYKGADHPWPKEVLELYKVLVCKTRAETRCP